VVDRAAVSGAHGPVRVCIGGGRRRRDSDLHVSVRRSWRRLRAARKSSLTLADMAKLSCRPSHSWPGWPTSVASFPRAFPAIQPAAAGPDALSLVGVSAARRCARVRMLLLLAYSCVATMVVGRRESVLAMSAAGAALLSSPPFDQIMAATSQGGDVELPTGSAWRLGRTLLRAAGGALLLLAFAVPVGRPLGVP